MSDTMLGEAALRGQSDALDGEQTRSMTECQSRIVAAVEHIEGHYPVSQWRVGDVPIGRWRGQPFSPTFITKPSATSKLTRLSGSGWLRASGVFSPRRAPLLRMCGEVETAFPISC